MNIAEQVKMWNKWIVDEDSVVQCKFSDGAIRTITRPLVIRGSGDIWAEVATERGTLVAPIEVDKLRLFFLVASNFVQRLLEEGRNDSTNNQC